MNIYAVLLSSKIPCVKNQTLRKNAIKNFDKKIEKPPKII